MPVSVVLVRGFAAYLQRRGIPAERYCRQAGISTERLPHSTEMLTRSEFQNAVIAARDLSRDPAIALRVGRETPASFLGLVGNLMANCETLRGAIMTYIRFASLIAPESRWHLEECGERVYLANDEPASLGGTGRFAREISLGLFMGFAEHFAGTHHSPIEVRLSYPPTEYAVEYRRFFGCPVVFNAGRSELIIDRPLLDVQQVVADDFTQRLLLERAEQLLRDQRLGASIVERARAALRNQESLRVVNGASLAFSIGMSPRALARRLAGEGVQVSVLIAEAKRDIACLWLRAPDSCIKELSDELGFSDPSCFHRAFKCWTGVTPGKYRASQTDRGPGGGRAVGSPTNMALCAPQSPSAPETRCI